jgi:RHS repeat-associated protein
MLAFNLRFPGQYYDAETGKHYNYFRDYDPNNGRYIESDPIGLKAGLNTYAYAHSNPLAVIDPTGLLGQGDVEPGAEGICNLVAEIPRTPRPEIGAIAGGAAFIFTVCIYKCRNADCPIPKEWVETHTSTWIWGCLKDRPPKGHRGVEGPRR